MKEFKNKIREETNKLLKHIEQMLSDDILDFRVQKEIREDGFYTNIEFYVSPIIEKEEL